MVMVVVIQEYGCKTKVVTLCPEVRNCFGTPQPEPKSFFAHTSLYSHLQTYKSGHVLIEAQKRI
jgi:uncharacterized protein YbbK (DUF523 family)